RHVLAPHNMVATTVEEEVERAGQFRRRAQHVGDQEADTHARLLGPPSCALDGPGAQVERGDVEALPGQPDGAGAGAAAQFQGAARMDGDLGSDALQFGGWLARLPGRVALLVALLPAGWVRHGSSSASKAGVSVWDRMPLTRCPRSRPKPGSRIR